VEFATKPDLGIAMLARVVASGIPFRWVTADEAYGQVWRLRWWMEERGIAHVLAVPRTQMVVSMRLTQERAHHLIGELEPDVWKRMSCGDGAQGPRFYDWAAVDIRPLRAPGTGHWLLARRSISNPDELAYYICFAPELAPLEELVRVAGSRWAIEECFQTAKNETGLDHHQVRGYQAWYRHITLSMAASVFLLRLQKADQKGEMANTFR
jgi:SRSO17 transposase